MKSSTDIIADAVQWHGTVHQGPELYDTLEFLRNKSLSGFIEIGSANGGSFHCWSSVIPVGPKISIDLNHGFGMSDGLPGANTNANVEAAYESTFEPVRHRNNTWRSFHHDVRIVEGNSMAPETVETVARTLNGELVDWLFIDGWHEYHAVVSDFTHYRQFVRSTGYIGFHDISQSESMQQFWLEQIKKYPRAWNFHNNTGIIAMADIV